MAYTKKEIEVTAKDIVKSGHSMMMHADMYEEFEGQKKKSVYLGTVFTIMPSGKYYQPHACSNVSPCRMCNGTGKSRKYKLCTYCNGGGSRTVTEIAVIRQEPDFNKVRQSLTDVKWLDSTMDEFECVTCEGTGKVFNECSHCQGLGSREALEDQWMQEALDREAEKLGCFIENGEGDPCDIFLAQVVEDSDASDMED